MPDPSPPWLQYEELIFELLQLSHDYAEVRHNVRLPGRLSGTERQIDVLVTEELAGVGFSTAFEAKHYKRRVNVKHVEEAIGLFLDVGVDRGVMMTTVGYSDAALRRAYADDVDIELDILNLSELRPFQSDGGAIPFAGEHGVIIPAPLGWVIDGGRGPAPARLYRRGLSFEEAYREAEFIYVGFWTKDDTASTIEELERFQSDNIRAEFPDAEIRVEELDLGRRWRGSLRTASGAYPHLEVTAYVEFETFILFAVLHTPELVAARNRRKLEYVVRKALPVGIRRGGQEAARGNDI